MCLNRHQEAFLSAFKSMHAINKRKCRDAPTESCREAAAPAVPAAHSLVPGQHESSHCPEEPLVLGAGVEEQQQEEQRQVGAGRPERPVSIPACTHRSVIKVRPVK